jgi:hypothetical protein
MATLPDVPQNTIITIGVLAVTGLLAYQHTLRTQIESQIHENYRHAKVVDAELQAGMPTALLPEKSPRSA